MNSYSIRAKVTVSRVPDIRFGDLGSPVTFELASSLGKSPNEIAAELSRSLELSLIPYTISSEAIGGLRQPEA